MSEDQAPNLNSQANAQLPERVLKDPYYPLRTPFGGYYLDDRFNGQLVRSPRERLSSLLAEAKKEGGAEGQKVVYTPANNQRPLQYLHAGALDQFEQIAKEFYQGGRTDDEARLRQEFRLPDPDKEPDAYWVKGERFKPELMILWGCEKEKGTSLPLIPPEGQPELPSVVRKLREKAMSWLRRFREGIEFARTEDPAGLGRYLAFPQLNAAGKVTHIFRLVNGQYKPIKVRTHKWWDAWCFWKARPLKGLQAKKIREFQEMAERFYLPAHAKSCKCVKCAPASANAATQGSQPQPMLVAVGKLPLEESHPPARQTPPEPLSYAQELRKGFQLPDPDRQPEAYYVVGPPFCGELLIVCPRPEIKDAEEMAQMLADWEWAQTHLAPEEQIKRQTEYQQQLQLHNLFERYFYSRADCLCLTPDPALGLPTAVAPSAPAAGTPASLPGAGPEPPPAVSDAMDHTIVGKLLRHKIRWRKVAMIAGGLVTATATATLSLNALWPKHLRINTVEVSNDPALDPENRRNLLAVQFNNRLGGGWHDLLAKVSPGRPALGQYTVRREGSELRINVPNANGLKGAIISLLDTNFEEGVEYKLTADKATDVWGNTLGTTNLAFHFVDKRSPGLFGQIVPASEDSLGAVQLPFDEPLDETSAETVQNYAIADMAIKSAELQKDRRSVVLQVEKPFESGGRYTLAVSNVTDTARQPNRLRGLVTNFVFAQVPLGVKRIRADSVQNRLQVVFTRQLDPQAATNRANFKLEKLEVGSITPLDAKAVELLLTDSFMVTNQPYVLHLSGLKEVDAKPGTAFATNISFQYTGPVDKDPPLIISITLTDSNHLKLVFSEALRKKTAEQKLNYALEVKPQHDWVKVAKEFRPELTEENAVTLNLAGELDSGEYQLGIIGLEDLAGNTTKAYYPFKNSRLSFGITQIGLMDLDTPAAIKLKLRGNVAVENDKAQHFQLEGIEGVAIVAFKLTLGDRDGNSTLLELSLSQPLPPGTARARVRYSGLKLKGEVRLQAGIWGYQ